MHGKETGPGERKESWASPPPCDVSPAPSPGGHPLAGRRRVCTWRSDSASLPAHRAAGQGPKRGAAVGLRRPPHHKACAPFPLAASPTALWASHRNENVGHHLIRRDYAVPDTVGDPRLLTEGTNAFKSFYKYDG